MSEHYPFQTEPLPYLYDYLEPCLNVETFHFHHDKHYAAYVENLNKTLRDYPQYQNMGLEQLIVSIPHLPKMIQIPVLNFAGGVYNHQIYFDRLSHATGQKPTSEMEALFKRDFGSYENWKALMTDAAMGVFGSGYAWLVQNRSTRRAVIQTTSNQNTPDLTKYIPMLLIDVWEHAYYLQYQNSRSNYIKCWFNIINWGKVRLV
jgi:Fe-Mn family superoxide dismutase